MEFFSAAGAIAAALLAVGAILAAFIKWVVMPNLNDFLHDFVSDYLAPIADELRTNGGTTIKDKITSIEASLAKQASDHDEHDKYTHRRNHDIISWLTAVLGWIKFFHRDDIAALDPEMAARIEQALSERRIFNDGPPNGQPERRSR